MLRGLLETLQFTKGLGFRLAALLSVAILPIGLMSLIQTMYLSGEAERSAETAIVGRTGAAAAGERALLQSALGTADALGPAVLRGIDDAAACSNMLKSFVERGATYVYAGFTRLDGTSECNSGEIVADMNGFTAYEHFLASPTTVGSRAARRGQSAGGGCDRATPIANASCWAMSRSRCLRNCCNRRMGRSMAGRAHHHLQCRGRHTVRREVSSKISAAPCPGMRHSTA